MATGGKRRVAVIGTGHRGAGTWGKELLATCGDDGRSCGTLRQQFAALARARAKPSVIDCPTFTDLAAMLAESRPDTLVVCTRDSAHDDHIVAGAGGRRRRHHREADGDDRRRSARASSLPSAAPAGRVDVAFNYRFAPTARAVKELLRSGAIGDVVSVDFMTDVANCGGCNVTCSFPFATSSCVNGVCQQGACLPGFYDRVATVPGCETACMTSNGGVEICDGQDNDCDGVVDDNPMAGPLVCKSMGVCAGVQPTCMGQTGWVCRYPATLPGRRGHGQDVRHAGQRLRRPRRRGVPDRPGLHGRLRRLREPERRVGLRQHHGRQRLPSLQRLAQAGRHRDLQRPGRRLRRQGRRARLRGEPHHRRQADLPRGPERHDVRVRGDPLRRQRRRLRLRFDSPALLGARPPALVERHQGRGPGRLREDRNRLAALHVGGVAGRVQQLGQHHLPVRRHVQRAALQRLGLHQDGGRRRRWRRARRRCAPRTRRRRRATSSGT